MRWRNCRYPAALPAALLITVRVAGADEFTQEEVQRWQAQFLTVAQTGRALAADDPNMIALEACITNERRGVALDPGRH